MKISSRSVLGSGSRVIGVTDTVAEHFNVREQMAAGTEQQTEK